MDAFLYKNICYCKFCNNFDRFKEADMDKFYNTHECYKYKNNIYYCKCLLM